MRKSGMHFNHNRFVTCSEAHLLNRIIASAWEIHDDRDGWLYDNLWGDVFRRFRSRKSLTVNLLLLNPASPCLLECKS